MKGSCSYSDWTPRRSNENKHISGVTRTVSIQALKANIIVYKINVYSYPTVYKT